MSSRREPPSQATWMLERLTRSTRNEALAGDLLEELNAGRSHSWYRWQVLSAIALHWSQEVWRRRIPFLFAAIWCLLSPAWQLLWIRGLFQGNLVGHIWRIPWPWSTICAFTISGFESLLFVWMGASVYLFISLFSFGRPHLRQVVLGIMWSTAANAVAFAAEFAVLAVKAPSPVSHAIDWHTLTLFGVVKTFTFWTLLIRTSDLPAMTCALWFLTPPGGQTSAPQSASEPSF